MGLLSICGSRWRRTTRVFKQRFYRPSRYYLRYILPLAEDEVIETCTLQYPRGSSPVCHLGGTLYLCGRRDSNSHVLRHGFLRPAWLAITPLPRCAPDRTPTCTPSKAVRLKRTVTSNYTTGAKTKTPALWARVYILIMAYSSTSPLSG